MMNLLLNRKVEQPRWGCPYLNNLDSVGALPRDSPRLPSSQKIPST